MLEIYTLHLTELLQLWAILLHLWESLHLENFITLVGPTAQALLLVLFGVCAQSHIRSMRVLFLHFNPLETVLKKRYYM